MSSIYNDLDEEGDDVNGLVGSIPSFLLCVCFFFVSLFLLRGGAALCGKRVWMITRRLRFCTFSMLQWEEKNCAVL